MKFKFLILMLVILHSIYAVLGQSQSSKTQNGIRLSGSVYDSILEEDKNSIYIKLKLRFALINTGDKALLFWKREKPPFSGRTLSKTLTFDKADLIENFSGIQSPELSKKQAEAYLNKLLENDAPPSDLFRTLQPGEVWEFSDEVAIVTEKENKRKHGDLNFEELKELSQLWLKVIYQICYESEYLEGWDKLQKRWEKFGDLRVSDVTSEPIELDVRSVLKIKESQIIKRQ